MPTTPSFIKMTRGPITVQEPCRARGTTWLEWHLLARSYSVAGKGIHLGQLMEGLF